MDIFFQTFLLSAFTINVEMQRKWKCGRCDYNFTRKSIVSIHSLLKHAKGYTLGICEKSGYDFSNNYIVSIHNQRGHVKEKTNAENITIILQASLLSTFTLNWSMTKLIYDSEVPLLLQPVWTRTYSWFNVERSHGSWQCQYQAFDMIWKFTWNWN